MDGDAMVIWLALACIFITEQERIDRRDADGDGYISAQWGGTDCDDSDAEIAPGQTEICNGVDDDCDGTIDIVESGGLSRFLDEDGDSYGGLPVQVCEDAPGVSELDGDCEDDNAEVNPGATETCEPGDEDCDGLVNKDDPSLDLSTAIQGWLDEDGDGYGVSGSEQVSCEQDAPLAPEQGDCDDAEPQVNPGEEEDCETTRDEDCDGDGGCNAPSKWTLSGPISGYSIGETLASVDVNRDGLDDLVFGFPSEALVGAVWGPAQNKESTLAQSFSGAASAGMVLDTAENFRGGKPVVLVGSEGQALLMISKVSGATLRLTGPDEPGFGELVQLMAGSDPLVAVGAVGAEGGDTAVFLFDGLASGNLDTESALGEFRLDGDDRALLQMEGLDHDGDGVEELAIVIDRDTSQPFSVLLAEPWADTLDADDVGRKLRNGSQNIDAIGSGDFDGDGYSDLSLGIPSQSTSRGEVLVFLGPISSGLLMEADLIVFGDTTGEGLGTMVSTLSSPDYADLLVVAGASGPVWIFDLEDGNADLSSALWKNGQAPSTLACGDLDGDGWDDVLLGMPDALAGKGEIRIHSGQAILP